MPETLRKRPKSHARTLKHLDERFTWYARCIEAEPRSCQGTWRSAHGGGACTDVALDLGCGKGAFAVAMARAHPDTLFVGLDCEPACIALAAQLAYESGLANVVFALADAEDIRELFAAGELACLYLNFPTPHPRKKHARERLTCAEALVGYRSVLADGAQLVLRTDSPMLFEFTLEQLELAAYDIVWHSRDLRAEQPGWPETAYEQRLVERGALVHALAAVPAAREPHPELAESNSLYDYLPDDLSTLRYVPYGMEAGVENMRNYRAKHGDG